MLERDTSRIRLVTHRLIGDEEVERAAAIVAEVVERHAVPPLELPVIDDVLDEDRAWTTQSQDGGSRACDPEQLERWAGG